MQNEGHGATWCRFTAILLLVLGMFLTGNLVSGESAYKTLLRIAINVAALASIFVVYGIWPVRGQSARSSKRIVIGLLALFVYLVAIDFSSPLQHSFLDDYPNVKHAVDAGIGWLMLVILVLYVVVVLLKHRNLPEIPLKRQPVRLGIWAAILLVGYLLYMPFPCRRFCVTRG